MFEGTFNVLFCFSIGGEAKQNRLAKTFRLKGFLKTSLLKVGRKAQKNKIKFSAARLFCARI
jgi:hypothetical protein